MYFCCESGGVGLEIVNHDDGGKYAGSFANTIGYNVTKDSQGRNMLTGQNLEGHKSRVSLKMLEVFEVECLSPPNFIFNSRIFINFNKVYVSLVYISFF